MSKNIEKIKNLVRKNVGVNCSVLSKQGRKKLFFENCVIDSVYPEIFVIKHTDAKTKKIKNLTFSYTDILTRKIFLSKTQTDETA